MRRKGFTLIEILVVITILLALGLLALAAFRGNESQRVRDGGRVAQAALLGSRDRALQAKQARGMRIVRDQQDPNVGTGFVYVAPIEPLEYTTCRVERNADDSRHTLIGRNVDWLQLQANGFIEEPIGVQIPRDGIWYVGYNLRDVGNGDTALDLTGQVFADLPVPSVQVLNTEFSTDRRTCRVQPRSEALANHAPISLPSGVVVDLTNSSAAVSGEILFAPNGRVSGPVSALGPIFMLLRDSRDVADGINPRSTVAAHRDMLVLTLFPQTGHVAVYPVDLTDATGDTLADDLFKFAKLGSKAGG